MASLKDVKVKITAVGKTKQITKAMNMVSSAKLRGAQQRMEGFRPYAEKFYSMLTDLSGKTSGVANALLEERLESKNVGIVLMTVERGLCGSFNVNLISEAIKLAEEAKAAGKGVKFWCVGRKGRDAIRKLNYELANGYIGRINNLNFNLALELGNEVINSFVAKEVDEVIVVYGRFINVANQKPTRLALLPVKSDSQKAENDKNTQKTASLAIEYIYEPDASVLLSELLPKFVRVQIYRGLLDTRTSGHAARMTAMDNATRSCNDMISALTMLFNKTRQAAITRDLMDIVGGAEALKG
ncbi:F0F1 ATP synthase subunit gamma [Desulfovibrio litoralis]|uniref:ATP synthase gamma chain n=1 Tax=Desulfovibrio litoralis DSM 11393 TaxID=1121455 RepID=A0A1M7S8J9_9BACT|nr:F0F1 ATP synthase subunit gamma [Desulfovibrio litoralis]SHN54622.1 ATP synthase F1 subcomplex gamma subunit [Desulfovibrio litoralis DSM 11393]